MSYRNKKLLQAIRELPCAMCGAAPPSQACHSNQSKFGKGMSLKANDSATFPACPSCHYEHDNGKNLTRQEKVCMEEQAILLTHIKLIEKGVLACTN